jgi:hypothetical protein
MRKGLSQKEMEALPVTEYWELYIFDSFIEPQGPQVDDFAKAQILQTLWLTSPNMTKESSRKIKLKDFMSIKPNEDIFKSKAVLEAIEEDKKREQHKRMLDSISDPIVRKQMEEAYNGKEK